MTTRVFIHLREDFGGGEHFAILGRVDKQANQVHIVDCHNRSQKNCVHPPRTSDGGLIEYIKSKSLHNDTFIILAHNPGDEYRELDHQALHAFDTKFNIGLVVESMYILDHYLSDLQETFPELYFS